MKKKLNYAFLLGGIFTLVGCVTGQPPVKPILACNAQQLLGKAATAPQTTYRADAPERYVVQRGDTLWGIAGRFLYAPSRWKEIWYANPNIKNPNLIYPGDIISYVTVNGQKRLHVAGSSNPARAKYIGRKTTDGRPIYRLSPTVRVKAISEPIPTIPREVVYPFVTKNRIIDAALFTSAPYVVSPAGNQIRRASVFFNQPYVESPAENSTISLARHPKVFAKGSNFDSELYDIYRKAEDVYAPIAQESDIRRVRKPIGTEAVYVGQLQLIEDANEDGVATLIQIDSVSPLMPNDILVPSPELKVGGDLFFMPQLPQSTDVATILKPLGTTGSQTGSQFNTLLISRGANDGIVEGMVFQVVRVDSTKGKDREGNDIRLPSESVGHVMIYRVYENLSYALVLDATDVIYPGDCLVSP